MFYWFSCFLAGLLFMAFPASGADASPIPLCGVVEGFYGTPWSHKNRQDMLEFCGEQGLNAYIYAPKNDPYHKDRWREPYPKNQQKKLAELARTADKHHVELIFAISPGQDLHYDGPEGTADRKIMLKKLEAIHDLGIRRFAIFFDDIKGMTEKSSVDAEDARNQAEFINDVQKEFRAAHEDVPPFIAVPTEYYYEDMVAGKNPKPYTRAFSEVLSPDVTVLYTGNGVVTEGISDMELEQADGLYGRRLGVWWNYPVTDYQEAKLALGPIVNLPKKEELPALFFNPMKHERLSKIALATGAEYAHDPEHYAPEAAWSRAIKEQYGELAADMELFASHSQRMENSWAHCGPQDAAALRREMDNLWKHWAAGGIEAELDWFELRHRFQAMDDAAVHLQKGLPKDIRKECAPQLNLFGELARADLQALQLLQMHRSGNHPKEVKKLLARLKEKNEKFTAHQKTARISDGTARAFLEEAIGYVETGTSKTTGR